MNFLKFVIIDNNIKNILIRDIGKNIGIIIQAKESFKYNIYTCYRNKKS